MNAQSMTAIQTVKELEKYPETMQVKITYFSGVAHGNLQFNEIRLSHEDEELQFAYHNQKTLYHREVYVLGPLLKQIRDLVNDQENQTEVEKYLVCTREIGLILPSQVTKDTMYLKHIKSKKDFASESQMIHYDGVDDTIFFEFMK